MKITIEQKNKLLRKLENNEAFKVQNLNSWYDNLEFWIKNSNIDIAIKDFLGNRISHLVNKSKNKPVIYDFGCGNGWILQTLKEKKVCFSQYYGIDYNNKMIDRLSTHLNSDNVSFKCFDIEENVPNSFNRQGDILINCLNLIETPNLHKVFSTFLRTIRKGGKILIISLNPILELFRDSNSYLEFKENLNLYHNYREQSIISKKIINNGLTSSKDYYRILYSIENYIKIGLKYGFKIDDIGEFWANSTKHSIKPLYEFIQLTI